MSKTVVVVSDAGRLVDATGTNQEANSRYSKFASRILGDSGAVATLNFGWNGRNSLNVSKGGEKGQVITLNAETVVVPDDLKVGGEYLKDIIESCTDLAIRGIKGTSQQIDVTVTENEDSSGSSSSESSHLTCTISLNSAFLSRISSIEDTIEDLFRFDEVYKVGDGLTVLREEYNRLIVNLGTGLKFEEPGESSDEPETAPITLDMDSTPTQGSMKPVTSDGIYRAIQQGGGGGYGIGYYAVIESDTGNMALYRYEADSSSSDSNS